VAAALLFGALHQGAAKLDLDTEHVTREVSLIVQAVIILSVSAEGIWNRVGERKSGLEVLPSSGGGSIG
jgi:simple sugar transport system permease protein